MRQRDSSPKMGIIVQDKKVLEPIYDQQYNRTLNFCIKSALLNEMKESKGRRERHCRDKTLYMRILC